MIDRVVNFIIQQTGHSFVVKILASKKKMLFIINKKTLFCIVNIRSLMLKEFLLSCGVKFNGACCHFPYYYPSAIPSPRINNLHHRRSRIKRKISPTFTRQYANTSSKFNNTRTMKFSFSQHYSSCSKLYEREWHTTKNGASANGLNGNFSACIQCLFCYQHFCLGKL